MNRQELRTQVGEFLAMGMGYDEALQYDKSIDEDAKACADKYFNMCEDGMNMYQAFVEAFFNTEE